MAQTPPQPPLRVIETPRLLLRTLSVADAPSLLPMLQQPEVMCWTRAGLPLADLEQAERWVSTRALGPGVLNFTIRLRERPDQVIGSMGAHHPPEVGYLLRSDYAGHGYATEALTALIPVLFEEWPRGADYVEALTRADNVGSMHVLEKCGFIRIGTLPGELGAPPLPLFRLARPGMTLAELGLLSQEGEDDDRPVPPVE